VHPVFADVRQLRTGHAHQLHEQGGVQIRNSLHPEVDQRESSEPSGQHPCGLQEKLHQCAFKGPVHPARDTQASPGVRQQLAEVRRDCRQPEPDD